MTTDKKTVVISLFGVSLDRTLKDSGEPIPERWERWRPTLSLCQQDDFLPDKLELLVQPQFKTQANGLLEDVKTASPETEVELHLTPFRDPWDFADVYAVLRDFADSYPFNPDDEQYFIHITTGTHVAQICLFMLTEMRHLPARLIQTSPPASAGRSRGRRKKGIGTYTVIDLDLSKYDQLAARFQAEHQAGASFLKAGIETKSPIFNSLMENIEVVASKSTAPILLTGATGVGKTQLARRIFELKKRVASHEHQVRAFIEVNCATLRGDGAMSALFGHAKGAFTGALHKREGLLQAANGGVLFLDEVGELGLDEQAMLLRAIEDGVFVPLGSDRPQHSEFQLIAGTNRDLFASVATGDFREDLLARIDLWSFELPSLAQRREDIEPNLDFELAKHSQKIGRQVSFNREARKLFLEFAAAPTSPWRANFRDFGAAVTRLVTLAGNKRIGVALVEAEIGRLQESWRRIERGMSHQTQMSAAEPRFAPAAQAADLERLLGSSAEGLDHFDKVQLTEVLKVCRSSKSLAAAGRALFAESRKRKASTNDTDRLKKYLARFGLDWESCTNESTNLA